MRTIAAALAIAAMTGGTAMSQQAATEKTRPPIDAKQPETVETATFALG